MARREEQLLAELQRLREQLDAQEESGSILGFLGGFALGALVGGVLALAYAPQAGEETREQLRETSIELKERATRAAEQAKDQAGTLQAQAQDALGGVRERAQSLTETAKDQVQTITTRLQGAATEDATEAGATGRNEPPGASRTAPRSQNITQGDATTNQREVQRRAQEGKETPSQ